MSVQELNQVHRRYIKVSNAFKSAWTFHQFIQGLRKVFIEDGPESYSADFQSVYNDLKQVSKILSEVTVDQAGQQLDAVEDGLRPLIECLLTADEQVSPGLLRQFFQRVKNYDDNILSQLVKFYLYFRGEDGWHWDRLDKADYLSTKVCEEYQDTGDIFVMRDRTHVREMAEGFWTALGVTPVAGQELDELLGQIETLRLKIAGTDSIDDIHEHQMVQRYRAFKHQLGDQFFQPQVLAAIIETNLVLKNNVQRLYQRDEQRIVAEYQQVFDLERETPGNIDLSGEMGQFRESVERFEKQLEGDGNIRLEDIATLREQMRHLLPQLRPKSNDNIGPQPPPPELREFLNEEGQLEPPMQGSGLESEYLAEQFSTVVSVLDDTNSTLEPRKVVLQPEVFSLGIEAREVLAYRRLYGGKPGDREREEVILRTAALRIRIESDVEEVRGILDDSSVSRDTPIFLQAQVTLRYSDLALRRLNHLMELAVLESDAAEAKAIQRLRMKLMRAYSGLWLLIYKE